MKRVPILIALFLLALPSLASTRTWTGTTSNLWSVAANWGGTAPVAGDDLVFPAGAANLATSNDFAAGTSFNSLTFSGAASYSIAGNALTVGAGGVTNNATSPAINVPVTLAATQTWLNSGANMTFSHVNLNGQSLTINSASGGPAINGIISGSGTITKSGNGLWIFNGSNTFSGQLLITAGTLLANAVNAFGTADDTAANGTIISSGAQLQIVAGFTYPAEQITVNGSGLGGSGGAVVVTSSGNVTLNGTVILGTNVGMNVVGSSITFSGPITGSGQLGMSGNGAFVLRHRRWSRSPAGARSFSARARPAR